MSVLITYITSSLSKYNSVRQKLAKEAMGLYKANKMWTYFE